MKPLFLLRTVALFLVLGLAPVVAMPTAAAQDVTESLSVYAANVEIVSATWGTGDIFIDVTARVRRVLAAPEQDFPVNPEWLGHDPVVGYTKVLVTVFQYAGQRYILSLDEGAQIGVGRLRACVRDRTRKPPDGPALVGKTRPETAAELTRFMAGTTWNIYLSGGEPGTGWTFHADGTLDVGTTGQTGKWRVVGPGTLRLFSKDTVIFNDDFTRWRSAGDSVAYFGLLAQ